MVNLGPTGPIDLGPVPQPPLEGVEEYVAQLHDAVGPMRTPLGSVLLDIATERLEQDAKWGEQNHRDGTGGQWAALIAERVRNKCQHEAAFGDATWKLILEEEVFEAFAETDTVKLRTELIQVAAVAANWIQAIDRRLGIAAYCEQRDAIRMANAPQNVPPVPEA